MDFSITGGDNMTTSKVTVVKLVPGKDKHLKNTLTNEIYEGEIYLAKSLKAEDFIEIDDTEYQRIKVESSLKTEERDNYENNQW